MTKQQIRRNTKQREIILKEIKKLYSHPTAEEIFEIVKKKFPEIGLATVYRNLDYLVRTGQIKQLNSILGAKRYDGCVDKHCHLICKECNTIIDLFDVKNIQIQSKELEKLDFDFDPFSAEMFGICKNCKNKKF